MQDVKRVILSPGEPAGIGPDIIIQIAQHQWPTELAVVGDPELFVQRATRLNLPLELIPITANTGPTTHSAGTLKIISVPLNAPCYPGTLNKENAKYVIECLKQATDACLEKKAAALVTGPIHKGIINDAGIPFQGHTEFLAQYCDAKHVVMLFVTPKMKVALATTHLPLMKVSSTITPDLLSKTIRVLHHALVNWFHCKNPTILVCGLNPHAGEGGHLGREEIEVIQPTIQSLAAENINVIGPLAADTIFTEQSLKKADAILAMYHDQALTVVKYADFHGAVNITLGLPIIRTSVDHGVALDLAGSGAADADSLSAAINSAIEVTRDAP